MKMNVLLYTAIRANEKKNLGVINKIKAQACALKTEENMTYYGVFEKYTYQIVNSYDDSVLMETKSKNRIKGRVNQVKYTYKWCVENCIELVYIRYSYLDNLTFNFISKLHKNGIKVVLEIPTYPFWNEKKIFIQKALQERKFLDYFCKKILVAEEIRNFEKMKSTIDLIVTYNPVNELFGVKTVCIDNGVDVKTISMRQANDNGKNIIFLLVANLSRWHGADRFIEGLKSCKNYKGFKPIFWIIGEGNELNNLEKLVKENDLENNVFFWGAKSGDELKDFVNRADIGIASLGMHRLGLNVASTLKVKEYCAYGLPFIYAYTEKAIEENCEFALKCVADDSPIDIQEVIEFALKVRNMPEICKKMRKLAEEKYDWTKIMKDVIDNLQ